MIENKIEKLNILYKPLLIWCFFFALLLGNAYNLFLSYDYKSNPDCVTYLAVANGEFTNQSLIRRYRVIVPMIAKGISIPIEKVYHKLWPNRVQNDDGPIRLGFLMANLFLMSFVELTIFYLLKAYAINDFVAFMVTIIVLCGGRWGNLFAAVPITDSLYMLVIFLSFYALKTGKYIFLIPCLLLGTIAKEAYVMLFPYVFFMANYPKLKLMGYIILGLVATFMLRYAIDVLDPTVTMLKSVEVDFNHIDNFKASIFRVFSIRGIGELNTIFGLFTLTLFAGLLGGKSAVKSWFKETDLLLWLLLPIALVHALLSTEVARMFYIICGTFGGHDGINIDKTSYICLGKASV